MFKFLYNIKDRQWRTFVESLDVKEIIIEEDEHKISFENIAKMMSERPAPRGIIINLLHLFVAKNNELTVLTSDEVLKKRFKVYYTKVMAYEELRKIS